MPIEIRDNDFIWSAAKIIEISNTNPKNCRVIIRYEGWGSEWDEELPYPNPRLARIYTYTKRVKCLANVLCKRKELRGVSNGAGSSNNVRNWTDVWPCTVSFRMPHPGPRDARQLSPEELLRLETNIFVQPYAPHLLSSFLQKGLTCGGWWITANHLRIWKDFEVESPVAKNSTCVILREVCSSESYMSQLEYHFSKDFVTAYKVAKSDKWLRGFLPPKTALLEGSLVDDRYRVKNVGGDAIDGVKYTGEFDLSSASRKRSSQTSSRSPSPLPTPKIEKIKSTPGILESASLPQPILVNYEHPGVRRLENSGRWASVVKIAGNDVFLGTFASQTEAVSAREGLLVQCSSNIEEKKASTPSKQGQAAVGPVNDLLATPVEAVIQAFEQSNTHVSFSLQNWITEHTQQLSSEIYSLSKTVARINKRKQAAPKQVKAIAY